MTSLVHLDTNDRIATMVLDDPSRRNAMSTALFDGIEASLARLEADDRILVLRIRAEGPAFCAGFDLGAMAEDGMLPDFLARLGGVCRRLRGLPAITVIEVQGPAIAGGCALVSAGDLVHAGPDARFGYPVHPLGISPAVTLPTLMGGVGSGTARRMTMSGELMDAESARNAGLVHVLASTRDELAQGVAKECQRLASLDPTCLRETKRFLNELDRTDDDERFTATLEASVGTGRSEDTGRRLAKALDSMRARTER